MPATKKTTTKKSAPAKAPKAKAAPAVATPAAPEPAKKTSALAAAAAVLAAATEPMTAKELIAAIAAAGTWTSPGGKTPEATLSAAIGREIVTKGDASRFRKTAPGRYTANATATDAAPEPAKKPKGKKAATAKPTIPDGTPGPESMSELFRI